MSYATAEEYKDRNKNAAADNALIADVVDGAARFIDRRLGWCEGAFAPISSRAVTFWPRRPPRRVLRLRDSEGTSWPLRTWTQIDVDYGGTGTPDRTWTPDGEGDWIVAEPVSTMRPHRVLRIWGAHNDATESIWPCDPGTVTVTATWGWPVIPDAIRELTIHVARSMLDSHAGGAAAVIQGIDSGVQMQDPLERLWRRVEMEYSAGRVNRLGIVSSAAGSRW